MHRQINPFYCSVALSRAASPQLFARSPVEGSLGRVQACLPLRRRPGSLRRRCLRLFSHGKSQLPPPVLQCRSSPTRRECQRRSGRRLSPLAASTPVRAPVVPALLTDLDAEAPATPAQAPPWVAWPLELGEAAAPWAAGSLSKGTAGWRRCPGHGRWEGPRASTPAQAALPAPLPVTPKLSEPQLWACAQTQNKGTIDKLLGHWGRPCLRWGKWGRKFHSLVTRLGLWLPATTRHSQGPPVTGHAIHVQGDCRPSESWRGF